MHSSISSSTYPLCSKECIGIAFEWEALGLVGYLIRPLTGVPTLPTLLPVPPPPTPPTLLRLLLPLKYGEVDRDRELDAYADGGGTGEVEWSRTRIRFGLNGGDCDDNFVAAAIMLLLTNGFNFCCWKEIVSLHGTVVVVVDRRVRLQAQIKKR